MPTGFSLLYRRCPLTLVLAHTSTRATLVFIPKSQSNRRESREVVHLLAEPSSINSHDNPITGGKRVPFFELAHILKPAFLVCLATKNIARICCDQQSLDLLAVGHVDGRCMVGVAISRRQKFCSQARDLPNCANCNLPVSIPRTMLSYAKVDNSIQH